MKKLLFTLLAAAVVVGCDKDESYTTDSALENVVKFSSGSITRVTSDGDDYWEEGDAISISTVGFTNTSFGAEYSDVKYVSDIENKTDGIESAITTGFDFGGNDATSQIIFPNAYEGTVDFYAVYPDLIKASATDYYVVDISGQDGDYGSVDFMTASAKGFKYGTSEKVESVDFSFEHRLAKVVITVGCNDNLTSLEGLTTSISKIYQSRCYDRDGSQINEAPGEEQWIDTSIALTSVVDTTNDDNTTNKTATVTAILHPVTSDEITETGGVPEITFTVGVADADKRTFTVGFGSTLSAGKVHNYSIDLGNDYPVFNGSSISNWGADEDEITDELYPNEINTNDPA